MKATTLLLPVVLALPASAAAIAIETSGANSATFAGVNDPVLQSVTANGVSYNVSALIQFTLTGFAASGITSVLVQDQGSAPGNQSAFAYSAAQRRALIETDWRGDKASSTSPTATATSCAEISTHPSSTAPAST